MLTIEQALSKLPYWKSEYFRWKFNISYWVNSEDVSEKDLLKKVNRKSMNGYKRWERTQEYKALVDIYLATKSANDILEVYDIVSKKAKKGDSKSIEQLLKLHKEIQGNAKDASSNLDEIIEKGKLNTIPMQKPSIEEDKKEYDDELIV